MNCEGGERRRASPRAALGRSGARRVRPDGVGGAPRGLIAGAAIRGGEADVPHFVVNSYHGPAWIEGRPMREQDGWPEHRAFMNGLPDGFVLLGGPVDDHRQRAMLVVRAVDLAEVHRRLDPDPWLRSGHLVEVIEPWEILIGAPP